MGAEINLIIDMLDSLMIKAFLSACAIALTLIAFFPYIRSILHGKTRPHAFSWVIWSCCTFIVFLAQLADRGGAGAWPIGVSGIITVYVAILAYSKKTDAMISAIDWLFFIVAISTIPLWYFTADPLLSVILLTTIDLLGFAPTVRKAYVLPFEEHLTFYVLMTIRNGFAIMALEHYSVTTTLFPSLTALACLLFIIMVTFRRRVIEQV